MNGVVSAHQRKQGLNYKINFGVEIPRIKEIASAHTKQKELAKALWQENIRECKLLAIFLMPNDEFTPQEAEEWIGATPFTEIADHIVTSLIIGQKEAASHALAWLERKEGLFAYCAFLVISHLLRKGTQLTAEQEKTFLEAAVTILGDSGNENILTKKSAYNAMIKYLECNEKDNIEKARLAAKNIPTEKNSIINTLLAQ